MHPSLFLLLLPVIAIAQPSGTEIFDPVPTGYNRHEPPSRDGPTEVKVGMYINHIAGHGRHATVTMYLRQAWRDPRLAFDVSHGSRITISPWYKVWVPDTFFREDLYSFVHEQTVPNRLMKVSSEGDVWYVIKMSMKVPVRPTNERESLLTMSAESYGYTMDTLYFSPLEHPLDVDPAVVLPENMPLVDSQAIDCSQNYTTGAYPCLRFQLKFQPTQVEL